MPSLAGMLRLNEDVIVAPVTDLPAEAQAQIESEPGDFAICRLRSRSGSKIVDAQTADLLTRFREPRTLVESVILFGRARGLDPNQVLEDAYPLLRQLVAEGVLVSADETTAPKPNGAKWEAGDTLVDSTVVRTLQVLDDTEIYLVTNSMRRWSVIKIERSEDLPAANVALRDKFTREIEFLSYLDGQLAPRLYNHGLHDERMYLEMEFVRGVDATAAAAELREGNDPDQKHKLHALMCCIADAYARLHGQGVLHGDVHPRNVIVNDKGEIRLIDFGLSRCFTSVPGLPGEAERGGLPFFLDPELARAYLTGVPAPPATPASEQYALAAMLYYLITGHYWQDFRLGRREMLEDIVNRQPLSFAERGVSAWPKVEATLNRSLSKNPESRFESMVSFAEALANAAPDCEDERGTSSVVTSPLNQALQRFISLSSMDGPWLRDGLTPAPVSSVTYGSAGIALGILHIAQRLNDARLLATADIWSRRSLRDLGKDNAFYNRDIQITLEIVGEASPYHAASGIHAVAALVGCALANPIAQAESVSSYLESIRRPTPGLDLTLGDASTILGAAILLDALPTKPEGTSSALRTFGDNAVAKLWKSLDEKPPIRDADIEYLGIAHGWAGFIYATLQWCSISETAVPTNLQQRVEELTELAIPRGRGIEWPWTLRRRGEPQTMPGWCNGTCGYVFLWTIAHAIFGESRYLDFAEEAAWNSWESPESIATLCCGLVGRVYALINLYHHTQEKVWLDRARNLGMRAAKDGRFPLEYPHSLYKGEFGLAVLAADLEQPEQATMPFFEPAGYLTARGASLDS